jgi:O-antigen/teichoic acid export membrane protein
MNIEKSSVKVLGAKIVTSVAGFLAVVVFSQKLGASPLGTYYPFMALLGIFAIPADFGIRSATEKRISEGTDQRQYLGTALALKFVPLLFITLGILVSSEYIETYLGADLAVLLVITLFVQEAAQMSMVVLRGELRVGETAIIQVLRPLGWLLIGYLFFVQGYGVAALVYGQLAGLIAMVLLGWWKVSVRPAVPSMQHARSLLDYGRYSVISSIEGYFYNWMDVAILTMFVAWDIAGTRAGIGAYENAWRI